MCREIDGASDMIVYVTVLVYFSVQVYFQSMYIKIGILSEISFVLIKYTRTARYQVVTFEMTDFFM